MAKIISNFYRIFIHFRVLFHTLTAMKKIYLFLLLFYGVAVNAQDSLFKKPFEVSGYAEAYYSYDFGNPSNHKRPSFFYSFNRHNEINLNLALIKASYNDSSVRGNIGIMAGTYAQYNLAAEEPLLRHIYEANAGVKLSKKKNLWLDAGIMPSHIGFESAIGKDCCALTRSILADNSPYYEAGVKIAYTTANEKLYLAAMYLNGWQRIQKIPGNQTPAFGTQIIYKPKSAISLNWSTYAGNEKPDSVMQWRYFNNFYGLFRLSDDFDIIAGFDIGVQQQKKHSEAYDTWYSPVLILDYNLTEKVGFALRGEYYSDEKGVIIATGTKNGFQTMGYSLTLDVSPTDNILIRVEGRALNSKDKIFEMNNKLRHENYFVTSSIALSF